MVKAFKANKLLALLLALGFLGALVLCGVRAGREAKNTRVCFVMTAEDLALLSRVPEGVRVFDGGSTLDGVTLLLEDDVQYTYVPRDGLVPGGNMVRCFYMFPQFAARVNYLGYQGPKEIENYLYRAVTERNIRVIWLTPFADAQTGETVTDAAQYEAVVRGLTRRLARQGITVGQDFTYFTEYEPAPALLGLTYAGVLAAGALLLCAFLPPKRRLSRILAALCALGAAAAAALGRGAVPVFAFGSAVIFPCLAARYVTDRLAALDRRPLSREAGAFAGTLLAAAGISLAGGLFVGAIQSSSEFQLAILNFRGVKASQILPVLFAAGAVLWELCPPREILASRRFALALALPALLCAVGYYVLRSGDSHVTVWEQRARNLLENVLLVRPRTKEFLAGWPSLALASLLCARGRRRYSWPFAILSSVACTSIVNTFCHSRAPLWLSAVRAGIGAAAGCALGLILIALTYRSPKQPKPEKTGRMS